MNKNYYLVAIISLCLLIIIAGFFAVKNINSEDSLLKDSSSRSAGACVVGGCSLQLCLEPGENTVSTCEYTTAYACYHSAKCERQSTGKCGWTDTDELKLCLSNAK